MVARLASIITVIFGFVEANVEREEEDDATRRSIPDWFTEHATISWMGLRLQSKLFTDDIKCNIKLIT